MRKRINLPVDKLIAKPTKTFKPTQQSSQTHKRMTFEELYRQARKQSHTTYTHQHLPYNSANTSQNCSESLKSSVHTPQNSNRTCARKQNMKEKLNRSLETKSASLEKLQRPTRSFSGQKKMLMEQWKNENSLKQSLKSRPFKKETLKERSTKSEQEFFHSQFTQTINRLDHNNHSHLRETQCFLNIEQIFQIMKQLHYLRKIQDEKYLVKLWQELQGQTYGGIPSLNLYQFLTYINHYNPKILLPKSQKHESQNTHKKIILNSNLKIVISQQSKLEIYEQYLALRVNRILYGSQERSPEGTSNNKMERTSNIKIVDDDIEKSEQKQNCKEVRKMSFVKKNESSQGKVVVPSVKKAVKLKSSVNKAKKGGETLEKDKSEETICYSEISDTKDSGQNLTSNESVNSIQSSETNEQPIERKPILSIDVNLGEGVSQKLLVYEGETAVEVSKRLVQKYNIDQALRVKFQGMLNGHIRNLLWRIEQVSQQMFSDRQQ